MNVHHSEGLAGILAEHGYRTVDSVDDADIVLLNTCMVRQKAEDKVLGRIGALAGIRAERPLLVGLGGCMPQVRGVELLERLPSVDFLFGTSGFAELPRLIERARTGQRPSHLPPPQETDTPSYCRAPGVRAMVTITEGCSSRCSYCVVPQARGPLRSRPPDTILDEVRAALDEGFPEILLLGQNVDSYGTDTPAFGSFAALLRSVAAEGPLRVRFTSSHPRDITEELLDTLTEGAPLCPHIHLACQSGSDRVLRAMNRGYTRKRFLDIVRRARSSIPALNVTTDLIVGFPGEREEDVRATLDLVAEARFGAAFVAMYSPRPGTRSAQLPDDVPVEEKRERLHRVLDLSRALAEEMNRERIGDTVEMLVEGRGRSGGSFGRSADHRTVIVNETLDCGEMVAVSVESSSASALRGRATAPTTVEG